MPVNTKYYVIRLIFVLACTRIHLPMMVYYDYRIYNISTVE